MKYRLSLIVLLLLSAMLFFGCGADGSQEDENVWVIAEEISYDAEGEVTARDVYAYEESQRQYCISHYNQGNIQTGYTDVVLTKDGTRKTETYHFIDESLGVIQYDYAYREDGKPLSRRMIHSAGDEKSEEKELIWQWNQDGTAAEVLENDVLAYVEEYDEQGREKCSYNDAYETLYTYSEQKMILRTSYTDDSRVEYVVHNYDAQGREIETLNYEIHGGDSDQAYDEIYTEENLTARAIFEYDDDGHSYTVTYYIDDGKCRIQWSEHVICKPLHEMC